MCYGGYGGGLWLRSCMFLMSSRENNAQDALKSCPYHPSPIVVLSDLFLLCARESHGAHMDGLVHYFVCNVGILPTQTSPLQPGHKSNNPPLPPSNLMPSSVAVAKPVIQHGNVTAIPHTDKRTVILPLVLPSVMPALPHSLLVQSTVVIVDTVRVLPHDDEAGGAAWG